MKIVTKLTIIATAATFMFAGGIGLTWGNAYTNGDGDVLQADHSFGVWMNVNESTSFGWEGTGLKVGFTGPGGMQMRLGFDPSETVAAQVHTTIGMSRTWWTSTGDGWGTNLSTALDWSMTGDGVGSGEAGNFKLTMNLGFGF